MANMSAAFGGLRINTDHGYAAAMTPPPSQSPRRLFVPLFDIDPELNGRPADVIDPTATAEFAENRRLLGLLCRQAVDARMLSMTMVSCPHCSKALYGYYAVLCHVFEEEHLLRFCAAGGVIPRATLRDYEKLLCRFAESGGRLLLNDRGQLVMLDRESLEAQRGLRVSTTDNTMMSALMEAIGQIRRAAVPQILIIVPTHQAACEVKMKLIDMDIVEPHEIAFVSVGVGYDLKRSQNHLKTGRDIVIGTIPFIQDVLTSEHFVPTTISKIIIVDPQAMRDILGEKYFTLPGLLRRFPSAATKHVLMYDVVEEGILDGMSVACQELTITLVRLRDNNVCSTDKNFFPVMVSQPNEMDKIMECIREARLTLIICVNVGNRAVNLVHKLKEMQDGGSLPKNLSIVQLDATQDSLPDANVIITSHPLIDQSHSVLQLRAPPQPLYTQFFARVCAPNVKNARCLFIHGSKKESDLREALLYPVAAIRAFCQAGSSQVAFQAHYTPQSLTNPACPNSALTKPKPSLNSMPPGLTQCYNLVVSSECGRAASSSVSLTSQTPLPEANESSSSSSAAVDSSPDTPLNADNSISCLPIAVSSVDHSPDVDDISAISIPTNHMNANNAISCQPVAAPSIDYTPEVDDIPANSTLSNPMPELDHDDSDSISISSEPAYPYPASY